MNKLKYLRSLITPLLNEDLEIDTRIKKAKSLMEAAKHFFDNKDIDKRIKSQVYVTGSLNVLLLGCESWNLTKDNLRKLTVFHHGAIRRILRIKWSQVREQHIKNKEVRGLLCNIPDIDAFIHRRMATYIGKISRSDTNTFPKIFLAAWINESKKTGAPQLTCNNNFANSINKILPANILIPKQALLRAWVPLANNRSTWLTFIENYFETCQNTDYEYISSPTNDED